MPVRAATHPPHAAQRGAATLVMVLGLFMIMALAAAYASRGLVFEQRISTNNLRATQAFESAEAGLEWAIGMLGQGRVDEACQPTADPLASTFRDRYLTQDASGRFTASAAQALLRPTCVVAGGALSCSCPNAGGAVALPSTSGPTPAFQVRFITDPALVQPGLVQLQSRGCNSLGQQCDPASTTQADAEATVTTLVALVPALASPPQAALTVRSHLDLGGGAVKIANTDGDGAGLALAVGGTLSNDAAATVSGPAGSPTDSTRLTGDGALAQLNAGQLFAGLFGVDAASYKHQPAALRVDCSGNCTDTLAHATAAYPGRPIWVSGDLDLSADVTLGSDAHPLVLVVDGNIRHGADFSLKGLLYLRGTQWDATVGNVLVQGAVVAENNLSVIGTPTVVRSAALLDKLRVKQGSLVRVPGAWRDFVAR